MPRMTKILLLVVSAALVLTVFLGANASGVAASSQQQEGAYRQMNVYSEVLQHIQSDYVVDPNIPQVTSGALRGLLEALDGDSSYLSPDEAKAVKSEKPGRAQVGINVSKRFGYATVVSVVPNSPADKASIADGDIIESIGDTSTRDLSLAMIQLQLRGEPGTPLSLSVIRPRRSTPEKVDLTRAIISLPPVTETLFENSTILYIKPVVLDHDHVQQVESKLKSMNKSGSKKILLDLRDVAVGDVAEAERLANMLIKSGTITSLEGQKFPKQTVAADPSKTINPTAPVVVLVNRGTAGPAELVAAAILDNKRGDLVGEKTFGEGSQLKTFDLPDGSSLILSVAKYESPSGKKIEDEGVTPGMLVASAQDLNGGGGDDEDSSGQPTGITGAQAPLTPKPNIQVDDQLSKALELLKGKTA